MVKWGRARVSTGHCTLASWGRGSVMWCPSVLLQEMPRGDASSGLHRWTGEMQFDQGNFEGMRGVSTLRSTDGYCLPGLSSL